MLLPPNAYRADERAVLGHYREVARTGLPVVAYNNPYDTKVDLTPVLLARLFDEGLIVAVKEFSGDVRRAFELAELAPGLDLLAGSDDVCLELALRCGRLGRRIPQCAAAGLRAPVDGGSQRRSGDRPAAVSLLDPCCGGTPGPSSSRRSSCRWISPGGSAAPAAPRASRCWPCRRPSCGTPRRRPSPQGCGDRRRDRRNRRGAGVRDGSRRGYRRTAAVGTVRPDTCLRPGGAPTRSAWQVSGSRGRRVVADPLTRHRAGAATHLARTWTERPPGGAQSAGPRPPACRGSASGRLRPLTGSEPAAGAT